MKTAITEREEIPMYMDRVKLRNILKEREVIDLLAVYFSVLGDDKGLLVEKILDAGDFELAIALNDNLGWKCPIES